MAEQMDLDKAYSPSQWSTRMNPDDVVTHYIDTLATGSADYIRNADCQLNVRYGTSAGQELDIFGLKTSNDAPVLIFIHGGYWHSCSHGGHRVIAKQFVKAGAVVAIMGYNLAPAVHISDIIAEVHTGLNYILRLARERKSRGVYICGHSAGAHLAAMSLSLDFKNEEKLLIKGGVLMSGIYDMRPLVDTYVNQPLQLTRETAWEVSPANRVQQLTEWKELQLLIAVAENDPPTFHEQSRTFYEELRNGGLVNTRHKVIPSTDHFDIVENLLSSKFCLTQEIIEMMRLPS